MPTFAEIGLPQMQAVTWYAVVAPPGTPAAMVKAVNESLVAAIAEPQVRQRFAELGLTPVVARLTRPHASFMARPLAGSR